MLLYAVLMFAVAVLLGVIAWRIYGGNTKLIHDYHQTKVTDQAGYGKAFGKAMGVMALSAALSGVLGLLDMPGIALGILMAGFLAGIIGLIKVQKKYNSGVF